MQTEKHHLVKLGIIAGEGNLPLNIIASCISSNREFYVIIIDKLYNKNYISYPHSFIPIGQIGTILKVLNEQNVKEVVIAGSIKKNFANLKLDIIGSKLMARILKNKFLGDNSILSTIVKFIEERGFIVKGADQYLLNNKFSTGVLTVTKPNEQDLKDIELGKKNLQAIGDLDIGQAVIIENSVTLGIEAIEGTENLIRRCGSYKLSSSPSGCLVKMAKINQELRVDLPAIGIATITQLHDAGFKGVAIESLSSIIIDREKTIDLANEFEIFVMAI